MKITWYIIIPRHFVNNSFIHSWRCRLQASCQTNRRRPTPWLVRLHCKQQHSPVTMCWSLPLVQTHDLVPYSFCRVRRKLGLCTKSRNWHRTNVFPRYDTIIIRPISLWSRSVRVDRWSDDVTTEVNTMANLKHVAFIQPKCVTTLILRISL